MTNPLISSTEVNNLNSPGTRIWRLFSRMSRLFLRKLGLDARFAVFQHHYSVRFAEEGDLTLRLPRNGDFDRSLNLFDQREVLHRALIASAIKKGVIDAARNVIDSGAANGDCALVWAKLVHGTVYAIDPSTNNLRYIRKTAAINGISNIETINCALGEADGWLYPLYNVDHTPFAEAPVTAFSEKNKVSARTLDSMKAAGTLSDVGFIHLDVEGMEFSVIRSAGRLLQEDRPVLTFEAHISIDPVEEIFGILRKLDYKTFMINEVTLGGRPDCVNFMAFPNDAALDASIDYLNSITPVSAFYKATIGSNLIKVD